MVNVMSFNMHREQGNALMAQTFATVVCTLMGDYVQGVRSGWSR